jgi:hypothetical protein
MVAAVDLGLRFEEISKDVDATLDFNLWRLPGTFI